MDKQQAQNIIRETFESSFDKSGFTGFIKNLLNEIDDVSSFTYKGQYIPDAYKQYIKTLERIGKFSDGENSFDILVITLQKETSLERARTMQRNFIAWYLNGSRGGGMKDAALAAFVSPGKEDWRFSLVKMDYKFEKTKTGRMKVKEEFTPARRWSFLVGANEKSHTAQSRLVNILKNDEQDPTLEEIEKAFDIETVTKEFFLKYRELFLRTKEELDRVVKKDPKVKADFEAKGVDTVYFAKKLLGQIIFLYFLQKKGWFGVGRDDDWGTGSKHFLRELFEKKHADYINFYNDILEPLFYEALRTGEDRKHEDYYYSRFDCKIPFLNGGLFDPIGNYDWVKTDIIIPDKLFSNNVKTKEGDTGTGILDVFDRYNFTVKEDEPLEKEVAIDPELLGKSYEKFNAIRPDNYAEFKKALKSGKKGEENKFNKKFGVYYTPREIVHYMCQQSLINYLDTAVNTHKKPIGSKPAAVQKKLFGPQAPVQMPLTSDSYKPVIPKEDIGTLIQIGEQVNENELIFLEKEQKIKNGEQKTTSIKMKLPDSIRKNAKLIDDKLAEITVCDPAVGSGAFPVGMMSEIARARNVLSTFVQDKNRTPYEFKRRCIENSLYGVDIDPGAVEIAKLRLWLSLVVDEDDIKNIKPLPNLDYRIMQGNSLISEFMGINFDTDAKKNEGVPVQTSFVKEKTDELIEQFQQKKDEFLNESNVSRKSKLKEEIDDLLVKIFETKLKTQKVDYFNRLKNIENKYSVLRNKNQRNKLIRQDKEKLYKESGFDLESAEKQLKEFTIGRKIKPFFLWNLYFSEVFHNKGGFDVVIANPPYINLFNIVDKNYRNVLKNNFTITKNKVDLYAFFIERGINILKIQGCQFFIVSNSWLGTDSFSKLRALLVSKTKVQMLVKCPPDVFDATVTTVILGLIKKQVFETDITLVELRERVFYELPYKLSYSDVKQQVQNSFTFNHIIYPRVATKTLGEIAEFSLGIKTSNNEKFVLDYKKDDFTYKVLRGKDITRYSIQYRGKWIWYKPKMMLKKKGAGPRRLEYFLKPKILIMDIATEICATLDTDNYLTLDTINSIYDVNNQFDLKFVLGLLNSKFINHWFSSNFPAGLHIKINQLKQIPICLIKQEEQKSIISFVSQILAAQKADPAHNISTLEAEIDQVVYKLYDLTTEEIKIVEGAK